MEWTDRIIEDSESPGRKMVIKGTGIPVNSIIDLLARGNSVERILQQYSQLTAEDVQACAMYDEWRDSDLIKFE